jgi:hypothetical protein
MYPSISSIPIDNWQKPTFITTTFNANPFVFVFSGLVSEPPVCLFMMPGLGLVLRELLALLEVV